jgi:hypothetical protein
MVFGSSCLSDNELLLSEFRKNSVRRIYSWNSRVGCGKVNVTESREGRGVRGHGSIMMRGLHT